MTHNEKELRKLRDDTQNQLDNKNYATDQNKQDLEDQLDYLNRRIEYKRKVEPLNDTEEDED